jgi:hypothetical protein
MSDPIPAFSVLDRGANANGWSLQNLSQIPVSGTMIANDG